MYNTLVKLPKLNPQSSPSKKIFREELKVQHCIFRRRHFVLTRPVCKELLHIWLRATLVVTEANVQYWLGQVVWNNAFVSKVGWIVSTYIQLHVLHFCLPLMKVKTKSASSVEISHKATSSSILIKIFSRTRSSS